jgi:Nucleotidyltransferase domain
MTGTRAVPDDVLAVTGRHLAAADAAAPGLIRALYVTGSVALGDYQPGRSDIDFMAFTSRPCGAADIELLRDVHARIQGPASYDGTYVRWLEQPEAPDDEPVRPHIVGGEFRVAACSELTPSTWTEFARYALAVRGPAAATLGVQISRERLTEWNRQNLNGYWLNLATRAAAHFAGQDPAETTDAEFACWAALGAARLHYTLATGDITSKTGAGHYALELFPGYGDLIRAALTWRATGAGEFSNAMALSAADLVQAIVADANRRFGPAG